MLEKALNYVLIERKGWKYVNNENSVKPGKTNK